MFEEHLIGGEITRLVAQKRNRNRVNVHIDGGYAFALTRSVAGALAVGQHLSDADVKALQRQGMHAEARQRAMRLIARRPRAEAEVRANFRRHQIPEDIQTDVITELKQSEFLDDLAFARSWVENRTTFRPRGAAMLRSELRGKGVARSTIEAALESFEEAPAAVDAAEHAIARYARRPKVERWQRVAAYLARRGFRNESIKTAVAALKRRAAEAESEVHP